LDAGVRGFDDERFVTVGWEAGVFALDVERRGVAGIGFRDTDRPRAGVLLDR